MARKLAFQPAPLHTTLDVVLGQANVSVGRLVFVKDGARPRQSARQRHHPAATDSATARVVIVQDQPVALIRRFDRTTEQQRIPYLSGATLLQARRDDEHSYTELLDVMRSRYEKFTFDARQLWRQLVFNHLITNVDDPLQNIGFLYSGQNQWRLAPAFDLNPFPDKDSESKTWLSEDTGPITPVQQLLGQVARAGRIQASV